MLWLFTLTVFLSSLLLFLVQPMVGKMFLPKLGGTPNIWNTCMVFFQAALLAGYGYTHSTTNKLTRKWQIYLHLALLWLPLLALPLAVHSLGPPDVQTPLSWMLITLCLSVGLPFFVVSTSAPLIQRWFSYSDHPHATDPYFLYSASNFGSMIALLGYPVIMEPMFSLSWQSWIWSGGYLLLLVSTSICGLVIIQHVSGQDTGSRVQPKPLQPKPATEQVTSVRERPVTWRRRIYWTLLAFVPSSLMLGVTSYLTTDIAAVPFLWVVPLALYLFSFMLVFARKPPLSQDFVFRTFPIVFLLLCGMTFLKYHTAATIPIPIFTFFLGAMLCHGLLAADRPVSAHLTEYYLLMSVGGVLGGIFNSLAAPLLFNDAYEFPIMVVVCCMIYGFSLKQNPIPQDSGDSSAKEPTANSPVPKPLLQRLPWLPFVLSVAIVVGILALRLLGRPLALSAGWAFHLLVFAGLAAAFLVRRHAVSFSLVVAAFLFSGMVAEMIETKLVFQGRSFFSTHRVWDVSVKNHGTLRHYAHGTTLHGSQFLDEPDRPVGYFVKGGPFGDVFRTKAGARRNRKVGVIGLGTGALAAYAKPGEEWDFYEIDPMVVKIAKEYFSYLKDAEGRGAELKFILGDGRLELAAAPDGTYDILFLDAFTSDSVPVHLLTREALQLYLSKLKPDGILVFNISNRYLNLALAIRTLQDDADLVGIQAVTDDALIKENPLARPIHLALLARDKEDLGELADDEKWKPLPETNLRVWRDEYSNIITLLRWGGGGALSRK